jgi:hypothetical protein
LREQGKQLTKGTSKSEDKKVRHLAKVLGDFEVASPFLSLLLTEKQEMKFEGLVNYRSLQDGQALFV